jgi:hypothetical protein
MIAARKEDHFAFSRIDHLRKKINNEDYLYEAIQRIALILTNEILGIPQGGVSYEQQWKRRK